MFTELKSIVERSSATLLADFAGGAALVLILLVSLYLPSFT